MLWKKKKPDTSQAEFETTDHEVPLAELLSRLDTDAIKGLSAEEAEARLAANGPNKLTPPRQIPQWLLFLKNLFCGFNLLLWIGSIASIISFVIEKLQDPLEAKYDNMYLGIVLAVVVTVASVFQFLQEKKSSNIMKGFAEMVPPMASVCRDGEVRRVRAAELVVGDVVELVGGDAVPADVRVLEARGCKVDNSSLTGENEPLPRVPECTEKNAMETRNLAFFGTNVVEGWMRGVVLLTGDETAMGRIAGLTMGAHARNKVTPIRREMNNFIRIIGVVAFIFGAAFFAIALIAGSRFLEALVFLIGIIVANVPEGIVCTVTVCLTLTAQKMRRKACLVKNLEAVETLGSTSTICSDKTGTLTQNRMTVVHAWTGRVVFPCGPEEPVPPDALPALLRCAQLCSRAYFTQSAEDQADVQRRTASGDASEVAILRFCERTAGDVNTVRVQAPKVAEIPFNSHNKYQVSIHKRAGAGFLLVMKGAPEVVLGRCATYRDPDTGKTKSLDDDFHDSFDRAYKSLGRRGERVLGFCDFELGKADFPPDFTFDPDQPNFPLTRLRFLGLLALVDPPRPGVPQAVRLCQTAGIRVVMVTGDHPLTAQAIAEQVHIVSENAQVVHFTESHHDFAELVGDGNEPSDKAIVIHGEQLRRLEPLELQAVALRFRQVVFARTSPVQKLQIVTAYQEAGNIVAVTGDGVNDAPALSKANIGVAMGIAGTQVSQAAADMILLNDNFASIVTAVEEGRLIFDNLKKSIAYTLTSNIPELSPFLVYILFGWPLPMSIVAILCIDLGTDLWPAISIAYEPAESDIMLRPPRDAKRERLVNLRVFRFSYLQIGVLQSLAGFFTYAVIMAANGWHLARLYQIRVPWDNRGEHVLADSYGQEWSFEARKSLEHCCHGAFFYAIVVAQWADLIVSKTRTNSIVVQGFANHCVNSALLSTALLSLLILFVPYVNRMFQLVGMRLLWAMVPVPFAWGLFLYDEMRRWWIRRYPGGLLFTETYY